MEARPNSSRASSFANERTSFPPRSGFSWRKLHVRHAAIRAQDAHLFTGYERPIAMRLLLALQEVKAQRGARVRRSPFSRPSPAGRTTSPIGAYKMTHFHNRAAHMRWIWGAAVAACAVVLPGAAVAQSGQPGQGQAGQTTSRDSTGRMSDSTTHKRLHRRVTSSGDVASDTTKNQTQSGMTDASGHSTMGPRMKKLRPDQGQPVMAKGDTLRRAGDYHAGREHAGRHAGDSADMPSKKAPNDSTGRPSKMSPNGSKSSSMGNASTPSKMSPNDTTKLKQP
jgi:hypothetical protein